MRDPGKGRHPSSRSIASRALRCRDLERPPRCRKERRPRIWTSRNSRPRTPTSSPRSAATSTWPTPRAWRVKSSSSRSCSASRSRRARTTQPASSTSSRTATASCAAAGSCPARMTSTSAPATCAASACAPATAWRASHVRPRRVRSTGAWSASRPSTAWTPTTPRRRPHFDELTPIHPYQLINLESDPKNLSQRLVNLVNPIGKGQRALVVSPPKAGKTMLLKNIANGITDQLPGDPAHGRAHRRAPGGGHRHAPLGQGRGHLLDLRRAHREPHARGRDGAGDRQAPGRVRPRRGHPARLHHAPLARLQPGPAAVRPHPHRRHRPGRAVPAQALLRRRPQARGGRLADHHRDLPRRHRLAHGRRHLRGVQGHRQQRAHPRPQAGREAHLPLHRRPALRHPPRGAAARGAGAQDGLDHAPHAQRRRHQRGHRAAAQPPQQDRRRTPSSWPSSPAARQPTRTTAAPSLPARDDRPSRPVILA